MLSSLSFAAFLAYSAHGYSREEQISQNICRAIKRDSYLNTTQGEMPAIQTVVERLRSQLTPELEEFFTPDVVLVPTPGSAPLPPKQDALWVPRRICEELLKVQLGIGMEPLLVRSSAVPKSSYAAKGKRPAAIEHHDSFSVTMRIGETPRRILLVDDVITKGATLLAGASRLAEAFPRAEVRAFALIRTQNQSNHDQGKGRQLFTAIIDPIVSRITLTQYGAWRRDA